jgi:16S rRNA (guanine966-N2)-methyltransferase
MRVIAGEARSIQLVAPRDRATRPITDRVKETLFGILAARVIDARVLDLYAGSGALGIEALSRGARHATFVEHGREALASIRTNLQRTRLEAAASVREGDVLRYLEASPDEPVDLVFIDPPYADEALRAPLERLERHLAPDATIVVKHFWRTPVPEVDGLQRWRDRRFGETGLTFLERVEDV